MKFPEGNRRKSIKTGFDNDFLDMTLKVQQTKAIIDKWNSIQLKNLCIKGHNQYS